MLYLKILKLLFPLITELNLKSFLNEFHLMNTELFLDENAIFQNYNAPFAQLNYLLNNARNVIIKIKVLFFFKSSKKIYCEFKKKITKTNLLTSMRRNLIFKIAIQGHI